MGSSCMDHGGTGSEQYSVTCRSPFPYCLSPSPCSCITLLAPLVPASLRSVPFSSFSSCTVIPSSATPCPLPCSCSGCPCTCHRTLLLRPSLLHWRCVRLTSCPSVTAGFAFLPPCCCRCSYLWASLSCTVCKFSKAAGSISRMYLARASASATHCSAPFTLTTPVSTLGAPTGSIGSFPYSRLYGE
ncbi:unnamed protein product [Closterium sp. NIES-54]